MYPIRDGFDFLQKIGFLSEYQAFLRNVQVKYEIRGIKTSGKIIQQTERKIIYVYYKA